MSSKILLQNGLELLRDLPSGGLAGERRPSATEALPYDFRRPQRLTKEQLRALETMFERWVRSMEGWMLGRARGTVGLALQGIEQSSFSEFAQSLPTPCCSHLLDVRNSGFQRGVIELGHEFAFFLIERMLGGGSDVFLPQRSLTGIEQMVIRPFVEHTAAAMNEAWLDRGPLELSVSSFESIPDALRAAGGDEAVLVAGVAISAPGVRSSMSICLPFSVLDTSADARLQRRGCVTGSDEERRLNRDVVAGRLRSTRVPVSARFPEFRIPMRNLMALEPGSVLATSVACDTEVEVLVAGQARYRGTAARAGRRLAVRVNDTLPPLPGQKTISHTEEGSE